MRRCLLGLVMASGLWGGAVCGTKYALGGFGPVTLLAVALAAAAALLWVTLLARGYRAPRTWWLPVLLGLLEPALAYLADTLGLSMTSAVHGALLSGLESAVVVALAAVLLRETISTAAALAVLIALAGLAVLAGTGGGRGTAVGDLLVAGGVLSASLYTIVAKRFGDDSDPLSLTTWQFTVAAVSAGGAMAARWATGTERLPAGVPARFWVAAAVTGVAGYGVSFLLFNSVISRVGATQAAVVLNLIPVFAFTGATVFLGERVTGVTSSVRPWLACPWSTSRSRTTARPPGPRSGLVARIAAWWPHWPGRCIMATRNDVPWRGGGDRRMTVEPLAGYTVGITADRRQEEFAAALERRGATVICAPAIRIVPLADDRRLREVTHRCLDSPPDIVIATTGIGFRGWIEAAGSWGTGQELIKTIGQATVLARGPKARGAIRAAGLREKWSPESESSGEVLEYLLAQDLRGQRIALQLHGEPQPDMVEALRRAGAEVIEVPVYRWVPPEDTTPLERLTEAVSRAAVDAVAFTSAPAAASFLRTAREQGHGDSVRAALCGPVVAACVGPVTAGPLQAEGIPVIQPSRARLGALVKEIAEQVPLRRGH